MQKWFENLLAKVAKHNDYPEEWTTFEVCDKVGKWTPTDLIIREYLNNGGGSAKGFLGITPQQCRKAYDYILTIKQELIDKDMVSEKAWNNSGFPLWSNYNF